LLAEALAARFGNEGALFEHEPVVIDLAALRPPEEAGNSGDTGDDAAEIDIDFPALRETLARHGLNAVAVRAGTEAQMALALEHGLVEAPEVAPPPKAAPSPPPLDEIPTLDMSDSVPGELLDDLPAGQPARLDADILDEPVTPLTPPRAPTLVVDRPLRSGQQIYARGGDLVVTAVVSFGAEVIADGNIHIYAPLRGRAIAGAMGDTNARIFAASMQPQLLSIAGIWRTTETELPDNVRGKPAQVRLDGERLLIEPLES